MKVSGFFGFTVLSEGMVGMSREMRYPFVYTQSKKSVEAELCRDWGEAKANYDNPDFLDRLYNELKRPMGQGWNHVSVAYTLNELRGFIAEGRNLGLKFQQWSHPSRPARLIALDIDEESAEAREAVDLLGDYGALVFKTRDGYHALFVAEDDLVLEKNRYDDGFCILGSYFKVKAEAYITDERSKIDASRHIIVPVVGTPRAELFGCTVLYDRGQKVDRAYTLEELVEAIDALIIDNCVISFEDAIEVEEKFDYSSKEAFKTAVSRRRGLWKRLFGDDYAKNHNLIYEAVRNATVGSRNKKLYNAAKALAFLLVPDEEIKEKLTEIAKQIFTYKDPEYSRGTFKNATKTINNGIKDGKGFREIAVITGYTPREDKINKGGKEKEDGNAKSDKKIMKIFKQLESSGAKMLAAASGEYLLHLSNAVQKKELAAYVADKFNEQLNDSQANNLFLLLSGKLPKLDEANDDVVILHNILRDVVVDDIVVTYAYITIINRYKSKNRSSYELSLGNAINLLKSKFYDLCSDKVDEFISKVKDLDDNFYANYLVSVKLNDKSGFDYTEDLSMNNRYDVGLVFRKHDKDSIVDDTGKVYIRYTAGTSKRILSIAQFIEVITKLVVLSDDIDVRREQAQRIMDFMNNIISLQDDEIMLFDTIDIRKTFIYSYLFGVSRFHSHELLRITPKKKIDKKFRDRMVAKTLLYWTPVVFLPGILLVDGESGSGKSYLGSDLSHTANGEDAITDPSDPRNINALSRDFRTLVFEEGSKIRKRSQNTSKILTSEFSIWERLLFSNSDRTGFGRGKISIIIVTTNVEDLEHDMTRRMFKADIEKTKFKKKLDVGIFRMRAGKAAIVAAILNSILFTSVLKLSQPPELELDEDELLDEIQFDAKADKITEFLAKSNNVKAAIAYYKLCQFFDIDFEIVRDTFYESRRKAALDVMPGNWKLVYDFYMLCRQIVQDPPRDVDEKYVQKVERYLTKFFDGMTAKEIAEALQEEGEISKEKVNEFAKSLTGNAKKVGNIFFQLDLDFKILKQGKYNEYQLMDLTLDDVMSVSDMLEREKLSEENYREEYDEEEEELFSELPDDTPF